MKKLKKVTIVTDLLLAAIFLSVVAVSFFPGRIMPIYGGNRVEAIYNGNREKNNVSLMFNVYENAAVVNSILDVLEVYGAKATFFVGGCWADDNAETLKRIAGSGNEIGNHGYFHKDHKKMGYEENREEISLTGVITKALCDYEPKLFAPPSGSFNEMTLEAAFDLGYKVIMWSKDTIDWKYTDKATVYKRATDNVCNGDLVLMHPKEHTLAALPEILEYYRSIGLNAVTVGENIA